MIERALGAEEAGSMDDHPLPPIATRILRARETLGLSQSEIASLWGEPDSMYWDLEIYDEEALQAISTSELRRLASVLHVPLLVLLFGEEPSLPLPVTAFSEIVERLRQKLDEPTLSVDQLSTAVGWELRSILVDPAKLGDLPVFALRWVCNAVGIDWVTTLDNATELPA